MRRDSEDITMTDTDGIWDPETNRYYYPEYAGPFTVGSHGEKVEARDWYWRDKLPKPPHRYHAVWNPETGEVSSDPKVVDAHIKTRVPLVKDDPLPESAKKIAAECDRIKAFLVEKNLKYGNSALEPVRIFSGADTVEQLLVRIDDKLSRMHRGSEFAGDDTTLDLIGYLILLRIATTNEEKGSE